MKVYTHTVWVEQTFKYADSYDNYSTDFTWPGIKNFSRIFINVSPSNIKQKFE